MALQPGQIRPGEWKKAGRTAVVMWKRENKECLDFAPGIGMKVGAKTFSSTFLCLVPSPALPCFPGQSD